MKKMKYFKSLMLVVVLGVSFTSKSQGEALPYTMDVTDVTDWNIGYTNTTNPNSPYEPEAIYVFTSTPPSNTADNILSFEKEFDFSESEDILISFEFLQIQGSTDISYRIEIDGDDSYFNPSPTNLDVNGTIQLDLLDINSLSDPSNVSIIIYVECSDPNGFFIGEINQFEITHTPSSVGINDNYLDNNLEIYSFDKSIFMSSNEKIDADVMIYDMSGKMIHFQNLNITDSKTELNLQNLKNGFYIVQVKSENYIKRKRIFIK